MWAKRFVDWLTLNGAWFFDWLSATLKHVIDGLLFILQWPHPLAVVAIITGLSWFFRRSPGTAVTAVGGPGAKESRGTTVTDANALVLRDWSVARIRKVEPVPVTRPVTVRVVVGAVMFPTSAFDASSTW